MATKAKKKPLSGTPKKRKKAGVTGKVTLSAKKKTSIAKSAGKAAASAAVAAVRKSLSGIK